MDKKIEPKDLFFHCLPKAVLKSFLLCAKMPLFRDQRWYLAGGTALALQVGHRQSVDLDFFNQKAHFNELTLERELLQTKEWETVLLDKGTLYGIFHKAKMSFIAYPFFRPSKEKLSCGTITLLLPQDIAAMKIIAVSQRGRKRDFVDLYWYCHNKELLEDVLRRAIKHYPDHRLNLPHLLKSLTYFVDAEKDPMPRLFFSVTWNEIKTFFQHEVVKLTKRLFF